LVLGHERNLAEGEAIDVRAGGAWNGDNRGSNALSPIAEIAWRQDRAGRHNRLYAQVSGASQVPDYTALNSNPTAGLFRGNPNLPREQSTNWEIGASTGAASFEVQGGFFFRQERGLTDWTYRTGITARSANAVDIDTQGIETVAVLHWRNGRAVLGYTWLAKRADYRGAMVNASFYALNFPRQRATVALVWQPVSQIEVRLDNEYRVQEPNSLRRSGPRAVTTSVGVYWSVPSVRGLEFSLQVDNLWNTAFEEVPAVPAAPRQLSAGLRFHW
jgi:vitamin B12 transporter